MEVSTYSLFCHPIKKLHVYSPAAIDTEIEEAKKSLPSGAELFIGGDGGAGGLRQSFVHHLKRN